MRRKKTGLIKDISLSKFLFEQEEDLVGDDEVAEDAPSKDEEAEEVETEGEEGAAEDAEEDSADDEEMLDVSPDDKVKLAKSIDSDLEALLIDFETQARKTKEIETETEAVPDESVVGESLNLSMLIEQDTQVGYEDEIDLDRFTAEVARLVKNYTNLLDMEVMLINKARDFIVTRYGLDAEQELLDNLSMKHDIEIDEPVVPRATNLEVPVAVGAGAGGAGGEA